MTIYDQLIDKGEKIGIQKGKQLGISEGEYQNAVKVVINSYNAGLSIDLICQITNLSTNEVSSIIKEKGLSR